MSKLHLFPVPIDDQGQWQFPDLMKIQIRELDVLVCERIRTTRRHIKHFIDQAVFDKLEFIEIDKHRPEEILNDLKVIFNKDVQVGLFSEAGNPCIADPGHKIVRLAHQLNIPVQPYVGPSSILLALIASGFTGQAFSFHGYLPKETNALKQQLKSLERTASSSGMTQIFMETPYRNTKLMQSLCEVLSDKTELTVAMSINGPEELIIRKSIGAWKKSIQLFEKKAPAIFIIGKT